MQGIKDRALSLLWFGFRHWPWNFHTPRVWPKKFKNGILRPSWPKDEYIHVMRGSIFFSLVETGSVQRRPRGQCCGPAGQAPPSACEMPHLLPVLLFGPEVPRCGFLALVAGRANSAFLPSHAPEWPECHPRRPSPGPRFTGEDVETWGAPPGAWPRCGSRAGFRGIRLFFLREGKRLPPRDLLPTLSFLLSCLRAGAAAGRVRRMRLGWAGAVGRGCSRPPQVPPALGLGPPRGRRGPVGTALSRGLPGCPRLPGETRAPRSSISFSLGQETKRAGRM